MASEEDFKQAMRNAGIEPPAEIIADGRLHRFNVTGDKPRTENGWYLLHLDGLPAGRFGTWRDSGVSHKWSAKEYRSMTADEKSAYSAKMEVMKKQRDEETGKIHAECREASSKLWDGAKNSTSENPYLKRKGVNAYGLKALKDTLLVPVKDMDGILHSVQFIYPEKQDDGKDKKFKRGTNKRGHFHKIGKSKDNTVIVCEGYATGASIHQATGHAVVIAFDSGNLLPVAQAIRGKYPDMKIIIAADNDKAKPGNPGVTKATEAARAVGGYLTIPNIKDATDDLTDFNDLHQQEGIDEVRKQIATASAVADSLLSSDKADTGKILTNTDIQAVDEPLPLTRPMQANEPFPVEFLPPVMRAAVIRVHEVVQAPLDMICQSFLAAATLAVQPYANVLIDGRYFPLSNNFVAVAESGERKSSTDKIATGPIKERQRRESESFHQGKQAFEAAHAAWKNGRTAAFKEEDKNVIEAKLKQLGDEPKYVQPFYIFEEPSFEGIERAYSEGRYTLGLFSDEGGRFLGGYAMNKENQTKTVTGMSKLWDGEPLDRVRGGDGLSVLYGRRFSMHLMIQPVLNGQLFGNALLTGQGFLSRCLCSYPSSTIGKRTYKAENLTDDPAIIAYSAAINKILDIPLPLHERPEMGLKPPSITIANDAKNQWIGFANHIEELQKEGGDLYPIKGFASKAAEHAARIAGVLALFESPDATEISADALNGGIAIAQYYIGEALRLFHSSSDDQELLTAQKVLDWGKQQGGTIALVDLYQSGPNAVRNKEKATRMMQILEEHNLAERITGGVVVNGKQRRDAWTLRG